jgi:hypothetical protein
MWPGPHLSYNTAIIFEGFGKNHNKTKDGQSLGGTGLQSETSAPRSGIQWTTIGLVSFKCSDPSFELHWFRNEDHVKNENSPFNVHKASGKRNKGQV